MKFILKFKIISILSFNIGHRKSLISNVLLKCWFVYIFYLLSLCAFYFKLLFLDTKYSNCSNEIRKTSNFNYARFFTISHNMDDISIPYVAGQSVKSKKVSAISCNTTVISRTTDYKPRVHKTQQPHIPNCLLMKVCLVPGTWR